MAAPIESKVYGAGIGGTIGTALSTFVLWLLGVFFWNASKAADDATDAIAAVPFPVVGIVGLVLGLGSVLAGGYLARHTPREADAYIAKRAFVDQDEEEPVVEENAPAGGPDSVYPVPEYAVV